MKETAEGGVSVRLTLAHRPVVLVATHGPTVRPKIRPPLPAPLRPISVARTVAESLAITLRI